MAALEAARRGLRVVLVEGRDIASGTSSRSTKLLHGGVRYLELAVRRFDRRQLQLVREALAERGHWLEAAPFLARRLELLLPLTLKWAAELSIDRATAIARITCDPARILRLPLGRIDIGAPADLCLIDPFEEWIVGPGTLASQGKNTPFSGLPMTGRVRHTIVAGEAVFSRAG
jgi:hypothetical protein